VARIGVIVTRESTIEILPAPTNRSEGSSHSAVNDGGLKPVSRVRKQGADVLPQLEMEKALFR
jgi:hypothetical protein